MGFRRSGLRYDDLMDTHHLSKAQVALLVDISDIPCRIIGAKDRGHKGVIFTPHSSINLEDGDKIIAIREEHVSAWPNEDSRKVHIHHTLHLSDKEVWKIDRSTLADNTNGEFACAIWSTTISRREKRAPAIIKPKYDIVRIPSYSEDESTLVVCYTIATPAAPFPNLMSDGLNLFEIYFSKMKIGLYYTYLNIPSYERGRVCQMSTSMRRINNGPTAHCAGPVPHLMNDLTTRVKMQIFSVINGYINTCAADFLAAGAPETEVQQFLGPGRVINSTAPLSTLALAGIDRFGTLYGPMGFSPD